MPGMDFKGNRHDQNRIQPGMQQLEVSLVPQGRYSFSVGDISGVIIVSVSGHKPTTFLLLSARRNNLFVLKQLFCSVRF